MANIVAMGGLFEVLNITLDGNWQAVNPTSRTNNLLIKARGANALKVSESSAGTNYFTIPSGQSLTIELADRKGVPLYIQGTVADVAEVISMYE